MSLPLLQWSAASARVAQAAVLAALALACRERSAEVAELGEPNLARVLPPAPQGCSAAVRLAPANVAARSLLHARGSTAPLADTARSELSGCREVTAGPDAWHLLDLSAFRAPLELHAVVDASFDAVLELRRGACGDTVSLDCDRARGIAVSGSSLAARLEPGEYWLLVDGASAESSGEFQLQVELDPAPERCSGTLPNGSCEAALPLEPLGLQSVLLDEACAPRGEDGEASLWYELDLRQEQQPVLLHAAAWTLSEAALQRLHLYGVSDAGACGAGLGSGYFASGLGRSNAELSRLLGPGRYRLQVVLARQQRRAALQLQLDRDSCREGPSAQRPENAIAIDPALGRQVLEGNTACNTGQLTPYCAEVDAPEQFYRLDLRSAPGLVRARVTTLVDGLGFPPVLALLAGNAAETGEAPVYCDARANSFEGPPQLDLLLSPEQYLLVLDGAEPNAGGAYRLLVELDSAEPSACVDTRIDDCVARNGQFDCCLDWSPTCAATVELCGLARAAQDCLCRAQPSCCSAERSGSECAAARAACNYLCPAFAASEGSCLAPP